MRINLRSIPIFLCVVGFSLLVTVGLGVAVWDINHWPTDAEAYYMPAALRIPAARFLSEIHLTEGIGNVRWLHGKELYVAAIAVFQFLLNDFQSLRPLMLIGLLSVCGSAILIFVIARRFWGEAVALIVYLLFVFCLWPYIYILFAKHQTLGLFFFLASVLCLLSTGKHRLSFFGPLISGVLLGAAFYSSTVTSLYLPWFGAAFGTLFFYGERDDWSIRVRRALGMGALILAGFLTVFFYVNWPDIGGSILKFAEYVRISGSKNHFYYNQQHLQQWFPHLPVADVRGGAEWIIRYLFLILPVIFPLYLISICYLIFHGLKEPRSGGWRVGLMLIGLSVAPAAMAEIAGVAQYGANYFPLLIGILVVIATALSRFYREPFVLGKCRKFIQFFLGLVLLGHAVWNITVFVYDVYVPRMATTFLAKKILSLGVENLATYRSHLHLSHFLPPMSPQLKDRIGWAGMSSLAQMRQGGYAVIPPVSGDSLYVATYSSYNNFDQDLVLVQLFRRGLIDNVTVASYRTLINSRIWRQEEEIFSYRSLILGHHPPDDALGRVRIVDSDKIWPLMPQLAPTAEEAILLGGKIKNIGTKEKFYMFEGQRISIHAPTQLTRMINRIWKRGTPDDSLILSIYRLDPDDPIWIPAGQNFSSRPLPAADIVDKQEQAAAFFQFDPPLELEPGTYYVVIYRTGAPDDDHYYQIESGIYGIP